MPIIFWILIFIFFTFLLIFFMPITIRIYLRKEQKNDRIAIEISTLLGLLKYKIDIPVIDWMIFSQQEPSLEIDTQEESSVNSHMDNKKKNFFNLKDIHEYQDKFTSYFESYYSVLLFISKKIWLKKLQWTTEFGTGDAAITGTITGLLWIIKGALISFLKNNINCEDINTTITPNFQKQLFNTSIDSIIHIHIGYIIIAAIKFGVVFITKGGEGYGKSSY